MLLMLQLFNFYFNFIIYLNFNFNLIVSHFSQYFDFKLIIIILSQVIYIQNSTFFFLFLAISQNVIFLVFCSVFQINFKIFGYLKYNYFVFQILYYYYYYFSYFNYFLLLRFNLQQYFKLFVVNLNYINIVYSFRFWH